jgi:hypothetical protein
MYVPLTKSLFKSAGITVSHFFSMLPSTLKYRYSFEPVRMHFPAKQPYCTNDTVYSAACSIVHSMHGEKVGCCYPSGLEKTLCKWAIYVPLVTKWLMRVIVKWGTSVSYLVINSIIIGTKFKSTEQLRLEELISPQGFEKLSSETESFLWRWKKVSAGVSFSHLAYCRQVSQTHLLRNSIKILEK